MKDKEIVLLALSYWINKMTTGNATISVVDALNQGTRAMDLPLLTTTQNRLVEDLKSTHKYVLETGSIHPDWSNKNENIKV